MKPCAILVLLAIVVPAWAGLGDLGKLKKLAEKKDDSSKKEDGKQCSSEKQQCNASEPAEPTKPMNKPEDVDKGGKIKTQWHDVKVGQMVKYNTINDMAMKEEVVEVNDRVVLMKTTTYQKGKPVSKMLMYYPRFAKKVEPKQDDKKKKPEMKITDLPDETLKIGEKKIKCKVRKTEMKQNGKTITTIIWSSEKVPFETVKMKSDSMGKMQVIRELVEFKK